MGTALGMGLGLGLERGGFSPLQIAGCVYMGCTDTSAYPTAVVFPADPLVNGNFEGAAGPANWTQFQSIESRQPGTRTGGTGSYVGRLSYDNSHASGLMYQDYGGAIGNTYRIRGWYRTDGNCIPRVLFGTTCTAGVLSNPVAWTPFDLTGTTAGADAYLRLQSNNLAAGYWVEFDDLTISPANVSQLTDLTGLGHHLIQSTASKQPLWVASGAGGVLRADGSADFLKATNFTLPQPSTVFIATKWTRNPSGSAYLFDGSANDCGSIVRSAADNVLKCYAGTGYSGASIADATWAIIDAEFNGASSGNAVNGGARVTGATGATALGGATLFGGGSIGAYSANADVAAILIYSRSLSEPERQRVIRWMRRLASRLAVTIP